VAHQTPRQFCHGRQMSQAHSTSSYSKLQHKYGTYYIPLASRLTPHAVQRVGVIDIRYRNDINDIELHASRTLLMERLELPNAWRACYCTIKAGIRLEPPDSREGLPGYSALFKAKIGQNRD
jgi:hypothetical protein